VGIHAIGIFKNVVIDIYKTPII